MVGQHDGRTRDQSRRNGDARRVELWQVNAGDVVFAQQRPRDVAESGHDHALADPKRDGRTNDPHAFDDLLRRQGRVIARCEDGHTVTACRQTTREAFDIDRQATDMWSVVGQRKKNLHNCCPIARKNVPVSFKGQLEKARPFVVTNDARIVARFRNLDAIIPACQPASS